MARSNPTKPTDMMFSRIGNEMIQRDGLLGRVRRFATAWAYPNWESGPEASDGEAVRKQCDEISKTIWTLTTALAAACLFCCIMLAVPDATLVSADAKITIPIASLVVSYK